MPVDGTVRGRRESIGATSRALRGRSLYPLPSRWRRQPAKPSRWQRRSRPPAFVSGFSPCTRCAPAACSASRRGSRGRARPAGPRVRSTFPVSERRTELAVPGSAEPLASKSELSVVPQGHFVSPLVPAGCPWLREHLQRLWSTCCVPGSVTPTAGQPRGPGDRQRRFPKVARSRSRPASEPLARSPLAAGFPPSVSAAPYTCVTGRRKGPGVCAPIFL